MAMESGDVWMFGLCLKYIEERRLGGGGGGGGGGEARWRRYIPTKKSQSHFRLIPLGFERVVFPRPESWPNSAARFFDFFNI